MKTRFALTPSRTWRLAVRWGLALSLLAGVPSARAGAEAPAPQTALSLAAYLDEVRQANLSIQSAEASIRALDLSVNEARAFFSPQLAGEISRYESKAQNANPAFLGDHTSSTAWNLSVTKRWETGTLTSLGYKSDLTQTSYPGSLSIPGLGSLSPSSAPYYTSAPTLTVSQPLWKDFLAAGARATVEKVAASARAAQAMNRFAVAQTLFAAERAYIQVALLQATVRVQESSYQRNLRILEVTRRHVRQNVSDIVDEYQSEAAVKQVELALSQTREDLANATRNFNLLRNRPDARDVEPLESLQQPADRPERLRDRPDVLAAAETLNGNQAATTEIIQKYLPDLSLYATASLTGRDAAYAPAASQSFSTAYPVTTVGVKFSANLDWPLISDTIAGAKLVAAAGDVGLRQKRLDLDKDWESLLRHWDSVNARLQTASELESLQKAKSEREKIRYQNGRTTDFQVLRFEDDYAQASLQRMRLIADLRLTLAQAKLYNGGEPAR